MGGRLVTSHSQTLGLGPHGSPLLPLQDLKTVLSLPQFPGEFLHPVVYACTAVMLLCLLASAATYIVHRSAIRISRKGRHTLLNFCFHAALTFTVFAGGINRTKHPILCQGVGILLHYSTLSTILWVGVTARNIYKQVTKKALPCPGADQPPYPKQPLLRYTSPLTGTAPHHLRPAQDVNYGSEDEDTAYCWMAWEPSLGAFYGPAALIVLVTCVYFLGTYIQLRRHPERRYELRERSEEQQRLAVPEGGHPHGAQPAQPCTTPACDPLAASQLQNEHSFKAQLRAAAFTLFLFMATWAFGALAVSQGHFLDMVFSCLYGAFCVTLGLFVLIHHCAKREDVWQCWWSCCPSRGDVPQQPSTHPTLDDSPCPGQARGFSHPAPGHCKMTNLQAAQGHASCLSPATPCCAKMHCEQLMEDEAHSHMPGGEAFLHEPHLHRCLEGRTKPHYFHPAASAPREYAYHIPSSLDGSPHSSRTDSPPSSLEGPMGVHTLACCTPGDPFPMVSQPEGSDASSALYGCPPRLPPPGPALLEMLHRTQSLPFGSPGQNGLLKGDIREGLPFSTDGTGNIRTGPWKNETTV
uniref:G-protein coupled receptors family 2 profile 2 domain-containing protein n=1 Tax=Spermophilus dauricus TaxID=99837 RepID=A0A8C9QTG4_SPEDA